MTFQFRCLPLTNCCVAVKVCANISQHWFLEERRGEGEDKNGLSIQKSL